MKKVLGLMAAAALAVGANAGYVDITVYDGTSRVETGVSTWYGVQEDEEVEAVPNAAYSSGWAEAETGQKWDLEAFIFDGGNLGIVGGFDLVNGATDWNGKTHVAGDIFIDDLSNGIGYDYAIDLDFTADKYTVNKITTGLAGGTLVKTTDFSTSSDPFAYNAVASDLKTTGSFVYETGLTDAQSGYTGGSHNRLTGVDLAFLGNGTQFAAHFTPSCGNDNLMGRASVPEPSLLALLGLGLLSLGFVRRRK